MFNYDLIGKRFAELISVGEKSIFPLSGLLSGFFGIGLCGVCNVGEESLAGWWIVALLQHRY